MSLGPPSFGVAGRADGRGRSSDPGQRVGTTSWTVGREARPGSGSDPDRSPLHPQPKIILLADGMDKRPASFATGLRDLRWCRSRTWHSHRQMIVQPRPGKQCAKLPRQEQRGGRGRCRRARGRRWYWPPREDAALPSPRGAGHDPSVRCVAASQQDGIGVPQEDGGTSHATAVTTAVAIALRRYCRSVHRARGSDGRVPLGRGRACPALVAGRRPHHR